MEGVNQTPQERPVSVDIEEERKEKLAQLAKESKIPLEEINQLRTSFDMDRGSLGMTIHGTIHGSKISVDVLPRKQLDVVVEEWLKNPKVIVGKVDVDEYALRREDADKVGEKIYSVLIRRDAINNKALDDLHDRFEYDYKEPQDYQTEVKPLVDKILNG